MRDEKGERMLIIRQSTPYGTNTGDHGLLFIAYSNSLEKFDTMLDRMVGIPDGHNDGIMKFST
jgi:putative iron-dependent peroxidase